MKESEAARKRRMKAVIQIATAAQTLRIYSREDLARQLDKVADDIQKAGSMNAYDEYLQRHVNDPRRLRPDGQYTSVDETHAVIVWEGPTWSPTGDTLEPRPGTPCAESGGHLFVSGCCADCGLVYS